MAGTLRTPLMFRNQRCPPSKRAFYFASGRKSSGNLAIVRRYAPRFIAGEQIGRSGSAGLSLEIHVSQRPPVVVTDDETTAVVFLYVPR